MKDFEVNLNKSGYFIMDKPSLKKDYVFVDGPYGIHEVRICTLKKGGVPSVHTAIDKVKYLINRFDEIHSNKYSYLRFNYINKRTTIAYVCLKHGLVKQSVQSHMKGNGCKKCGYEKVSESRKNGICGWGLSDWISLSENSKLFDSYKIYVIKAFSDNEEFIKIGRTFKTIGNRFKGKLSMPYEYVVLKEVKGSPEFIFNLENKIKNEFSEYSYTPNEKFNGMHECFNNTATNLILEGLIGSSK